MNVIYEERESGNKRSVTPVLKRERYKLLARAYEGDYPLWGYAQIDWWRAPTEAPAKTLCRELFRLTVYGDGELFDTAVQNYKLMRQWSLTF